MSIVFDVIVLSFPIPVIAHLQMPTKRKLGILAIFWLGALYVPYDSVTMSLLRVVLTVRRIQLLYFRRHPLSRIV